MGFSKIGHSFFAECYRGGSSLGRHGVALSNGWWICFLSAAISVMERSARMMS